MKIEEIQLSYYPNITEDIKVNSSDKAYQIAMDSWNADTIKWHKRQNLFICVSDIVTIDKHVICISIIVEVNQCCASLIKMLTPF